MAVTSLLASRATAVRTCSPGEGAGMVVLASAASVAIRALASSKRKMESASRPAMRTSRFSPGSSTVRSAAGSMKATLSSLRNTGV